jgi:aminoglycoside N3'-acetyltransferase
MNNKQDFIDYFKKKFELLDVYNYDIFYIYSDLRLFSQCLKFFNSKTEFCESIINLLLKNGKTVVMTTFSYTTQGVFDICSTKTTLGSLNKWILERDDYARSEHPLFSYSSLGLKKNIVSNIGKSAFGYDSVFHRLHKSNAAFLHIGRPVDMGNTSIHYIEQLCGATYRYHKCFNTKVFRNDTYVGTDYTAFLRKRDVIGEDFTFSFNLASRKLLQQGLLKEVGDPFENISLYPYDESIDFLASQFYLNPNIFINSNYKNYI